MKITLERFTGDDASTLGLVHVDGAFECFGLEDRYRETKVAGSTRIPAGTYPIKLRTEGGVHKTYAGEFKHIHKGMLWLQDVPGFEWIYIHVGNTHVHTEGCILVGRGANSTPGAMSVSNSVVAYHALYQKVVAAAEAGALGIEIIDRDRP